MTHDSNELLSDVNFGLDTSIHTTNMHAKLVEKKYKMQTKIDQNQRFRVKIRQNRCFVLEENVKNRYLKGFSGEKSRDFGGSMFFW